MQVKLYELRKEKLKMTQKEIATKIGISEKTYSEKERGISQFTQDEMFLISELVGKPLSYIFLPRKHQNGDSGKKTA